MALRFHDENKDLYSENPLSSNQGPLHTNLDGNLGGSFEQKFYLRNEDVSVYYTSITVGYESTLYSGAGESGTTGWGVKFAYGERRPTEAEWDKVNSGEAIALPDIGDTTLADTYTFHPLWIRVYCPGGQAAQRRQDQTIVVTAYERKVGA